MCITGQQVDAIIDLLLVECVPEEVVAFEVLIVVCEYDGVLEGDGGGGVGVVVDYFVDGLGEDEVEVDVVFLDEAGAHCMC